ncbi:DNA repair protein RadA [Candidatus Gottesmanbacteria bacterium]|nr:DNA repair protein RadA [Candidatus Gottesmanbacteria bacterium]
MKSQSSFICQQCGYKSPSFLGKCPNCGTWNSLVETIEKEVRPPSWSKVNKRERSANLVPVRLASIKTTKVKRVSSGIKEVDQVAGGGLIPGSVILLAGDPGIGKSTLTLQIISNVGGLYVSGEESAEQVKLRAERLKLKQDKIMILSETNVESIIVAASKLIIPPAPPFVKREKDRLATSILIVDSIQTLWSEELTGAPGAIGQVRECALKLLGLAKSIHLPIVLIGHVTKEGTIAGPKVLEHIVDTVLYLEGDRFQSLRLLRTVKNRFGPIDEVGVFSMEERGMMEVKNPSELFLGENKQAVGSVIVAPLEGTRPLLVEVQALTVASFLPLPRRVGTGINNNRLQMIVAIIQKHLKLPLGKFDIFINVASGIKVFEPAVDLGICLAIVSSFKNKPLPEKTVAIGEVGLLGEIRNVIGLERRIKEAKKLGFNKIVSPKGYSNFVKAVNELLQ